LQRLDGEVRLLRAVEADHHRVELLADLEALRTLLVPIATKVAALDEARCAIVADLHIEARVLNGANGDRERFALLHAADCGRTAAASGTGTGATAFELLDTERDALLPPTRPRRCRTCGPFRRHRPRGR